MMSQIIPVKKFSSAVQAYGTYWASSSWTVFGCLTFKTTVTPQRGEALLKNYMRRLGQDLKTYISYIAIPEYRYAGLGMPPIPLHFHFLAACPPGLEDEFLFLARDLWSHMGGNCKIEAYDATLSGTYYMAKLAGQNKFEWIEGNLEKSGLARSTDLYSSLQSSPYVPEHAKGPLHVNTLKVYTGPLKAGTPPNTLVPSVAKTKASDHHQLDSVKAISSANLPGGPNVGKIGHVWCKHVMTITGKSVVKLSPKEYGQLKQLRSELGAATMGLVEYAIHNWIYFGAQVVASGYPAAPTVPHIGFLCKNYGIALELAYQAACHKYPKSACEWQLLELYPVLKQNTMVG